METKGLKTINIYPMENVMGMNEVIPEESLEMQKRKQRLDSGITQNVWPKALGESSEENKPSQVKRKNLEGMLL